MPYYHKLGQIPHKRHTQFRKDDGSLYSEQLFSTEGFSSDYSLSYHIHPPTQIIRTDPAVNVMPSLAEEKMLKHRSFEGFNIKPVNDYLKSRVPVLVNNDCHISLAATEESMHDYFFKNADADEVIFVHEGSGKLRTMYGELFLVAEIIWLFREEPFISLNLKPVRTGCSLWSPSVLSGSQKNT